MSYLLCPVRLIPASIPAFALPLVLLSGCASDEPRTAADPEVREFLGPALADLLENAERIESYRVQRSPHGRPDPGVTHLAGMDLLTEGPALEPSQQTGLLSWIFDSSSHLWDIGKLCEPRPGVLLRAHSGADHVDIALCFECDMWGFALNSDEASFPTKWEDFDPVRPQLESLVKALFPDDSVIQGL